MRRRSANSEGDNAKSSHLATRRSDVRFTLN
jgi:hypothetical protein